MITYNIVKHSMETIELADMLDAHGARQAPSPEEADVVLLAADSVVELSAWLSSLGSLARKTLAVGTLPSINGAVTPEPGTMEGILEMFRPLGVLNWHGAVPGFLGSRELADKLDAGYMLAYSTLHYGSWIERDGQDAGDFICRVVVASK